MKNKSIDREKKDKSWCTRLQDFESGFVPVCLWDNVQTEKLKGKMVKA